eukprot:10849947-Heterocapsa_arctica.AAC.1
MKKGHNFDKLTSADRIAILAAFMIEKKDERAALSKLGAVRLSRREAIRFLTSKRKIQDYYTLMVQTTTSTGIFQIGYIMFEDVGNK